MQAKKSAHAIINFFSLISLVISLLAVIIIGSIYCYWSGEPWGKPAIVFPHGIYISPYKFATTQFPTVEILADYCKNHTTTNSELGRELVGTKRIYILPGTTQNYPVGCSKYRTKIALPDNLDPDVYYMQYRFTVWFNPINSHVYEFRSNKFTVTQ